MAHKMKVIMLITPDVEKPAYERNTVKVPCRPPILSANLAEKSGLSVGYAPLLLRYTERETRVKIF